jgi:hypothetical protein
VRTLNPTKHLLFIIQGTCEHFRTILTDSRNTTEWFWITVGVSVVYNFQTGNKIKLLTEYENVTQKFSYGNTVFIPWVRKFLSYTFIFYLVVSGFKIIGYGKPDNNLESPCTFNSLIFCSMINTLLRCEATEISHRKHGSSTGIPATEAENYCRHRLSFYCSGSLCEKMHSIDLFTHFKIKANCQLSLTRTIAHKDWQVRVTRVHKRQHCLTENAHATPSWFTFARGGVQFATAALSHVQLTSSYQLSEFGTAQLTEIKWIHGHTVRVAPW